MDAFIERLVATELKPALGCTEPISVAFTAGVAGKHLREIGDQVASIIIDLDKNVFKNGKVVEIPAPVPMRGNLYAAPLGALLACPEKGLEILQGLDVATCEAARRLVDEGKVQVRLDPKANELMVRAELLGTGGHRVIAMSRRRHDNIVFLQVDDRILIEEVVEPVTSAGSLGDTAITVRALHEFLQGYQPSETVATRLREGMAMNVKVMEAGLSGIGTGVGTKIIQLGIGGCSKNRMIARCAAAVDARMAGFSLPVMSATGSGNQGLILFLTHHLHGAEHGRSELEIQRALLLSLFLASRIKAQSGRLSALCGCVIASGMGAAAGLGMLEEMPYEKLEAAFNLMAADIMGILCDGAKASCALKVATGVNSLLRSLSLAGTGFQIPPEEGIIGREIEDTIRNIGKIATDGMVGTDFEIVKILERK